MKNSKRTEQGQAIILLAIGIITLLGFTALAIDGGRTYSEKRTIQGVADTSSMTGALYLGKLGLTVDEAAKAEAVAAAQVRAASNGYDTSQVTVDVYEDPQYYYVETFITSTVDPVFAQLVFGGDLTVNATSVARVLKIKNFALGQAFYAKNEHDCRAFDQAGTATLTIINSGVFSNSDCTGNPGSVYFGGSAVMSGEVITAAGTITKSQNASVTVGAVDEYADQQTLPTLPTPVCTGPTHSNDNGTVLSPGIYNGIHITNNRDVVLEPGLYCLDDDFRVQGGTVTGDDVMFYLRGNAGVTINGGLLYLTAPQNDAWVDGDGMYWNGMLFYMDYGNTSAFGYNGNVASYLEGTIFAPDGNCSFEGTSDGVAQDVQIICDTIDVVGGTELLIEYSDNNKYVPPFIIDLVQ